MIYSGLANFINKKYRQKKKSLHEPYIDEKDFYQIKIALKTKQLSTHGKISNEFSEKIRKFCKVKYCIPVNSATSALYLSLLSLNIDSNDEVIIPSLGFVASANAILYCNASPIFLDVEEETLGLDPLKLENFIKNKTKQTKKGLINLKTKKKIRALIVFHPFGNSCKIVEIKKICKKYKLKLIEDAAESLGSFYKRKHLGTFGDCGVISFNGNKVITTGSGGVLITNNFNIAKIALSKSKICKINHPYKFIAKDLGYNLRMPSLNASLGISQFSKLKKILKKKKIIHEQYLKFIKECYEGVFELITEQKHCSSNHWLNILRLKKTKKNEVEKIIRYLISHNIEARPLWEPLHKLKYLHKYQKENLIITNKLKSQLIFLPSGISAYVK